MIPDTLLRIFNPLFIASPSGSFWSTTIIWVVRVVTLLIILRNYIAPYVLERVAGGIRNVRVRSISLRSVRGIYVKRGNQTWRIDRIGISYRSASGEGSSRFTIKIEGLKLEIGRTERVPSKQASSRKNKRRLTLADLSPSPLAFYVWSIVARVYAFLEPSLRPAIRSITVACMRIFIRCLPTLTQALHFDLDSAEVTFLASPQSCIRIKEATLHSQLDFTLLEDVISAESDLGVTSSRRARLMNMTALRTRLSKSFARTWEKAWGKAQGTASITMTVKEVSGLAPSSQKVPGGPAMETFFSLPGSVDFRSSFRFSPSRGNIDPHSLKADLNVDSVRISIDVLHSLLTLLKDRHRFEPTSSREAPASPAPTSVAEIVSPTIPISPFIRALRSATSSRALMPKLKEARQQPWLSILMMVNVKLSSLKLATRSRLGDTYESAIKDIAFCGGLSSPDQNLLHQQSLGRNLAVDDGMDAEVYAFNFSARNAYLERTENNGRGRLRVVSVGRWQCDILVSQWASLWLAPSPFLSGDPNAPFLVLRIAVGAVEATERLEILQRLVADTKPAQNASNAPPLLPSILSPVPRVAFTVDVGSFCGRLICVDPSGIEPFAMEARTDGLTLSAQSHFLLGEVKNRRTVYSRVFDHWLSQLQRTNFNNELPDYLPLQMTLDVSLVLKPTFLRVRSDYQSGGHRFSKLGAAESDNLGDPIFSLETVEINGQGTGVGVIKDDAESIVSIDTSSIFLDLHCSADALSVEFWHPDVVTAVSNILSVTENGSSGTIHTSSSSRLLDRLPPGLSCTFSLARFVFFVTGPDLNPDEEMGITRGIALHTGISVHYCTVCPVHVPSFSSLSTRSQTRQKLYLPEERIIEAVAAAKSHTVTEEAHVFIRIALWDIALRSAAATQYVTDDPYIAERDDPALMSREFVQIRSARADINLSRRHGSAMTKSVRDSCQLILHVPHVRGTFQLVHVYSLLLAARAVKSLIQYRAHVYPPTVQNTPSTMVFQVKATVKTVQVFWDLSTQRFVTRIDSLNAHYSSNDQIGLGLSSFFLWVPVPSRINKWNEGIEEKWEEMGLLQKWCISLPPSSGDRPTILVEGDSARLRIPSGFVLAHLILDISVTVKCLRHLTQMIAVGSYSEMPPPGAEAAKNMPNLVVRIGCLVLEAADDLLETRLGLIWGAGSEACRQRLDREDAFTAKVVAILAAEAHTRPSSARASDSDYQFSAAHTISVEEARARLSMVHGADWALRLKEARDKRSRHERQLKQRLLGHHAMKGAADVPNLVTVTAVEDVPPLFRAVFHGLHLKASKPSFSRGALPEFLYEQGNGIPRDTQFSLLLPMHLNFTLNSLRLCLRDYPIPLLNIPEHSKKDTPVWEFDSDLVVAEEMGTPLSIDWIKCQVVGTHSDILGAKPMWITVPKTIMPVKSYANPIIRVTAHNVTSFAWGISYGPATQDLTRVLETLSTSPRDPSPHLGFWDKMRLIFHWKIKVSFAKEVRLHMKGTRDPYNVMHTGAGFALCWQGHPTLTIGYQNPDQEVVQMISDTMLIVIPNLARVDSQIVPNSGIASGLGSSSSEHRDFRKICAKFSCGVRFGVGFVPERSCGTECATCMGSAFERKCRFFNFRPHFDVKLEQKECQPMVNSAKDSYNGFRSDFIHLSVSLNSSWRPPKLGERRSPSSLHLSPRSFAHFWSWWALFEGVMSLPIRQGTYYPPRVISPKFGRHLATLKYQISVDQLFISHAYIDDSRESWVDGVTPFIGVKAMIDKFRADMHQRDQESIVPGRVPDAIKVVRHKPFYAAEVVLNGLDLRAMVAIFSEPLKQSVDVTSSGQPNNYRIRKNLPTIDPSSSWFDLDDFVEADWLPSTMPTVNLLPAVACSRLTYFKRNSESPVVTSKFGGEDSHSCFLGKEKSVPQVQISLASERIGELRQELEHRRRNHEASAAGYTEQLKDDDRVLEKKISLLEAYIAHLREVDMSSDADASKQQTYYMPSDTVSADEWSEFDNVYQVHCPSIFMNNAIRDILMQYYLCSRAWRGLEYHMATRAVKFIRDQAEAAVAPTSYNDSAKPKGPASSAQAAAHALRKILTGERTVHVSEDHLPQVQDAMDPLSGWSDGVTLRKSHFCLLLKPQIVLRSEANADSVCVLAAVQAKLQSFAIMDESNVEDPVSGKIMSRNYTSLNGLQTFSPANSGYYGDGCVPLEVLIDYRCESSDFDRLVPQTDATFHYDKFNRLRLRNNVTSMTRTTHHESLLAQNSHLSNETDLIEVHVPRFTVSASDLHFQDISNIITDLILFSDVAHKTHMERLETLVFAYDFTDLLSAANVVADLQSRLRNATETRREAEIRFHTTGYEGSAEILQLKAHIFLLAEELNLLFDAIKLAQERTEEETDKKSALLLHASASEISWRMLDERRDLLAKLAMRHIDYSWLSRQDSSTVNNLAIGDLQAFDGSPHAVWPEIISKHREPANHPLLKRELFILADWTVLAPVGGITIYESFELSLHPMRLQVDAKVGSRIMEYVWPARKHRNLAIEDRANAEGSVQKVEDETIVSPSPSRKSLDSYRALDKPSTSFESSGLAPPHLRRLGVSRSFTDLRSSSTASDFPSAPRSAVSQKSRAADTFRSMSVPDPSDSQVKRRNEAGKQAQRRKIGDAAEMKTRSSQKTFILVKISSLHLLLSIVKEESFDLRDARIRTRDLEYRNQTWSFEELVDQFIPADMTWRGWVKMAFQQPLVPVLPVARELISKTKWIASKGAVQIDTQTAKGEGADKPSSESARSHSNRRWRKSALGEDMPPSSLILTAEPESVLPDAGNLSDGDRVSSPPKSRSRMFNILHRKTSSRSRTHNTVSSEGSSDSVSSRHRSDTITPHSSPDRSQT